MKNLNLLAVITLIIVGTPLYAFEDAMRKATQVAAGVTAVMEQVNPTIADIDKAIADIKSSINSVQSSINSMASQTTPSNIAIKSFDVSDTVFATAEKFGPLFDRLSQLIVVIGERLVNIFDAKAGNSLSKVSKDITDIKTKILTIANTLHTLSVNLRPPVNGIVHETETIVKTVSQLKF